jgi:uncharacterized phage infection (PIP) family protein YhgE
VEWTKTGLTIKHLGEIALTVIFGIVGAVLYLKISKQVTTMTAVAEQVATSSRDARSAAKTALDAGPKIIDAADKIEKANKEAEDTLKEVSLATNQMQSAAGTLQNLIKDLRDDPIINAFIDSVRHQQTGSASIATATQLAPTDRWDELSELWGQAKEHLEDQLSKITDGRTLRKYSGIGRYTHKKLIETLKADNYLNERQAGAAQAMNDHYLRHRSRKISVDASVIDDFKLRLRQLRT